MKYITFILITLVFLGSIAPAVLAIEDQFRIRQQIGADTTAPSDPTNLTATAVSTSQINLSWDASTDDLAVTGYRVFRDGTFIATTTLTTYSDTGLSPSTTYSYTVSAFDAAVNISGLSNTATATTFDEETPPPTTDNTPGGNPIPLILLNLSVQTGFYDALIAFETNLYTQAVVSWGLTPDYEMGSIGSDIFKLNHEVALTGLTPNTLYYYKIEVTDAYGRTLTLDNQQFKTKALPDTTPPQNVTNLHAVGDDKVITLTWNNPPIDFDYVRIVKSDIFFPKDLYDGEVIYEGGNETYVDADVVYGKYYYYTLFVRDTAGNWSSGSMAKARLYKIGEPREETNVFDDIVELSALQVHPAIRALTLLDLDFYQDGVKLPVVNDTVNIQGDRELRIVLEYHKVPEILKTIAMTMFDPEDPEKTFSFLLRVNKDKTAYEATIAPLGRSGDFKFGVAILDHKNQGLKKLAGVIASIVPQLMVGEDSKTGSIMWFIFWLILMLLASVSREAPFDRMKTRNDYTY